jgi:hypothetical protein
LKEIITSSFTVFISTKVINSRVPKRQRISSPTEKTISLTSRTVTRALIITWEELYNFNISLHSVLTCSAAQQVSYTLATVSSFSRAKAAEA